MVMALYAIAELIEARAVDRARNAIKALLAMAPEDAEVLQADGSWLRQLTADVAVGATVRLRPGERVPLDGVITQGARRFEKNFKQYIIDYEKTFLITVTLILAEVVAAGQDSSSENIVITKTDIEKAGTSIPVSAIGEPVGSVKLYTPALD